MEAHALFQPRFSPFVRRVLDQRQSEAIFAVYSRYSDLSAAKQKDAYKLSSSSIKGLIMHFQIVLAVKKLKVLRLVST